MNSPLPTTQGKEGVEPKKSARLAEKRKLREEAGPHGIEEDYYFTPLTRVNRLSSSSVNIPTGSRQSPGLVKERLSPSLSFKSQVRIPTPPVVTIPEESLTTLPAPTVPTLETSSGEGKESGILESEYVGDTVSSQVKPAVRGVDEEEKPLDIPIGRIIYINRADSITLSFPPGMDYPLSNKSAPPPVPPVIHCIIPGCANRKKYSCSTTKAPLCSLECYNKNLAQVTLTTTRVKGSLTRN